MLDSQIRLLTAAKSLFLARGYAGTTVDAICTEAALTKGSFYHFYESKESLALGVLQWSLENAVAMLSDGPHVEIKDPVDHAFAYLDHFEVCAPKLWSGGCLLAVFALEVSDGRSDIQHVVSQMFKATSADLAAVLAPVVDACPGNSLPPATELADQFLGTLEGAIILAKAHREPERVQRAIRSFNTTLRSAFTLPV